jgi:hypothetical protein
VSNYDAFTHLSKSLFKKRGDLFAMLTAYFDDSGTSANEPVAVVAGYLSTVQMWQTFSERWSRLLSKNGLKQMRRADLENFAGEFRGWLPDRRTEFIKKAHAIIKRCTYIPIGVAVIKADFEEAFPPGHTARTFGLYSWCIHGCLAALGKWCRAHNHDQPINFVFEAGTHGRDQVDQPFALLYNNPDKRPPDACPIESWAFAGKNVLPLQAADVVAYELYKFTKNIVVDRGKRKVRYSAFDLFRKTDVSLLRCFNKRGFELLRAEGVPGWDY